MSVFKTEPARYSAEDFQLWEEKGILQLSPKFQRRDVWKTPEKSYLIDTILRGMTIPPLYLRLTQDEAKTKTIREVVDGQQRVRSVMSFIANKYSLSKSVGAPLAGKKFSQLSPEQQNQIQSYSFSFEIFKGISDQQILEVFCRLNQNGVRLNRQELRNGRYFGLFKNTCYRLAIAHLEFWRRHHLFTEQNIARMLEVQLTSELLIAGMEGMQDKKGSIDEFYDEYEESYPTMGADEKRFTEVIGELAETFDDELADSAFRRPPLFYTLYCVVFHRRFGIPKILRRSPKKKLTAGEQDGLRAAVDKLSAIISKSRDDKAYVAPKKYLTFLTACSRQTDNIGPRKIRFDTLYDEAF